MDGLKLTTKWLIDIAQALELLGFVDIHRRGRGRGTDFTIQPSGSIGRKYMVETLTSMMCEVANSTANTGTIYDYTGAQAKRALLFHRPRSSDI